jgi:hypothetical protein
VKNYNERRSKNITHVIYSFMIIQSHTESFILMMIIKLDQHLIILDKSWMKKHEVSYHDHDDSISFYFDHCNHLDVSERSYLNQTKKKDFFSKRIFSDQSEVTKDKEIKVFPGKINNSPKHRFCCIFTWIRNILEIRLVRLRVSRSLISKREWWSDQINNLFFEDAVLSSVQLRNLWQRVVNDYSLFRTITCRATINEIIY